MSDEEMGEQFDVLLAEVNRLKAELAAANDSIQRLHETGIACAAQLVVERERAERLEKALREIGECYGPQQWAGKIAREALRPAPPEDRVGCERPDGTLNIHAESETCEACAAPDPTPSEGGEHEHALGWAEPLPGPEQPVRAKAIMSKFPDPVLTERERIEKIVGQVTRLSSFVDGPLGTVEGQIRAEILRRVRTEDPPDLTPSEKPR